MSNLLMLITVLVIGGIVVGAVVLALLSMWGARHD
jgi:hypothetical protein